MSSESSLAPKAISPEGLYRVQVITYKGGVEVITHESVFSGLFIAQDYFKAIHIPRATKRLQSKQAGKYKTLVHSLMLA